VEINIYIDVLFLTNYLFDSLLLWVTGRLLRTGLNPIYLLSAAAIGALYAVLSFFMKIPLWLSLSLRLMVACLMVMVAYRPRSLRIFCRFSAVFLVSSLTTGGSFLCLIYAGGIGARLGSVLYNGNLYINLPAYGILALFLSCFFLLRGLLSVSGRIRATGHNIVPLRICLGKRSVRLRGFCDSGNLLKGQDGRGVMITEERLVKPLLMQEGLWLTTVNYQTLQGKGRLRAFLPDAMYLEKGRALIPVTPLYVGLSSEPLDLYQHWDAVLPHNFEEVKNYEIQNQDPAAKAM